MYWNSSWCKTQPATRNFHWKSLFNFIVQRKRLPHHRDSLFFYNQVLNNQSVVKCYFKFNLFFWGGDDSGISFWNSCFRMPGNGFSSWDLELGVDEGCLSDCDCGLRESEGWIWNIVAKWLIKLRNNGFYYYLCIGITERIHQGFVMQRFMESSR